MADAKNYGQFGAALKAGYKIQPQDIEGAGLGYFGSVFYVNSVTGSDTANDGRSLDTPYATITKAIAGTTANKGDVIFVMPGHSETRTAAITVNKAGIAIIGLGQGLVRPSITGNGTIDV